MRTHRPRHLNPSQTAAFQHDMARLPPDHQADVALKWRESFVNLANRHQNPAADGLNVVTSGLYAGILGAWDGENEAHRAEIVRKWKNGDAARKGLDPAKNPSPFVNIYSPGGQLLHEATPDPRTWFGINRTLFPTFGLGILAIAGVGSSPPDQDGMDLNRYLVGGTLAGVSYAVGTGLRDLVYARRSEQLERAQKTLAASSAPADPANNPAYGRSRLRAI